MKTFSNLFVVLAVILLTGFARRPFDDRLSEEMQERNLLPPSIEIDTREELGQTALAIALGGLRPLMAAILNLQAHGHWEEQEWYELERKYQTIVSLQPRLLYYWDMGSWHLYSNAYADYSDKPGVNEGRRSRKQKQFFDKGIAFLERGVAQNPTDWRLCQLLGNALSASWRPQILERAAECFGTGYAKSGSLNLQRREVYCLARIPARKEEAWGKCQEMWGNIPNRRFNTPQTIFFALQSWAGKETYSLEEILGSPRQALQKLTDYWFRQVDDFPMDGVAETINTLCSEFEVPKHLHPLTYPPQKTFTRDPHTDKSYPIDPRTGEPREKTWRSIWMNRPRDAFRSHLIETELGS